jgi:hypothetical protein
MPMATESLRRRTLLGLAAAVCAPRRAVSATATPETVFAAWDDDRHRHHVGLLRTASADGATPPRAAIEVPTRAHGLALEPEGTLLAVARRPGDWLLRWHPRRGRIAMHWNAGARRFNGHVERRGAHVFTTETELDSGQGVVVVRDAASLRELAAWPTQGLDPHDMLFDGDSRLWVANGGIATEAATGRAKELRDMDSSLVCIDAASGERIGQWRLDDPRLSMRHLALGSDGSIGVALQAEHDNAARRAAAPLLARWSDQSLRSVGGPLLAGYGGDVASIGRMFFVSAPRAGVVAAWHPEHGWREPWPLEQACALAVSKARLWCGGAEGLREMEAGATPASGSALASGLKLDNHAVLF